MVAADIGSEKVTVIAEFMATFSALFAGTVEDVVGAIVSTPTVVVLEAVIAPNVAVTVVVPTERAESKPVGLIVAMVVSALDDHTNDEALKFASTVPSENVALILYCKVLPTATVCVAGVTVMDLKVGVVTETFTVHDVNIVTIAKEAVIRAQVYSC